MKKINLKKILSRANDNFSSQKYEAALLDFSLILKDEPDNKEAKIGVLLSDMALSGEDGAQALFDYYAILRSDENSDAETILEDLISSLDGSLDKIGKLISEPIQDRLKYEDGIMYSDFKTLVKSRKDFRRAFEDVIFSTRVIITEREDFMDFLDNLVKYEFHEMALNYLESAIVTFPNDERLRALLDKLQKDNVIENRAT